MSGRRTCWRSGSRAEPTIESHGKGLLMEPTSLWAYEMAGAVADALPDPEREQFAILLSLLAQEGDPVRHAERVNGVRRWLRDAGWEPRS